MRFGSNVSFKVIYQTFHKRIEVPKDKRLLDQGALGQQVPFSTTDNPNQVERYRLCTSRFYAYSITPSPFASAIARAGLVTALSDSVVRRTRRRGSGRARTLVQMRVAARLDTRDCGCLKFDSMLYKDSASFCDGIEDRGTFCFKKVASKNSGDEPDHSCDLNVILKFMISLSFVARASRGGSAAKL